MEAMKMEHTIAAPADGVVQSCCTRPATRSPKGPSCSSWSLPTRPEHDRVRQRVHALPCCARVAMALTSGAMKITFCCTDTKAEPWLQGLSAALPGAELSVWEPGAPVADYAVVWAPPQQFMDEQQGIKALFNIGAGVDALLQRRLPQGARVVRLDDAGMAVQMAEYVCHAVIRHFREFDGYEADMAAGRWGYRKPRLRSDFPIGVMGLGVLGERVARALAQFEFPINGWSRSPKAIDGGRAFTGVSSSTLFWGPAACWSTCCRLHLIRPT
jgi:Phosphoglycerate dehydrogenase and related dehydrogenases